MFNKKAKKAPRDFTESMLPINRRNAFFDGIRQRYDVFIKCGLVIFISALPFVVVAIWSDYTYAGILAAAEEGEVASALATLRLIHALIDIPCFALIGFGCAAISRIQRQIVWGEPVLFSYHLKLGIKQNALRFTVLFLLYGGLNALGTYLSILLSNSFLTVVPGAAIIILFVPIGLFMLSQTVFYNVGLFKSIRNGITLYIKAAPITLLFSFVLFILTLTDLIPVFVIKAFALVLAFTVFIVLYSFAWLQYSCHVFDRFVNPYFYPELVGKGLYRPRIEKGADSSTE